MVVLLDLLLSRLTAVFLIILTLVIFWVKSKLSYWNNKKVPYLQPRFPWGNLGNLITSKKSLAHELWDFYEKMKDQGFKYAGFYTLISPVFIPIHPEYIKSILIKDFSSFHARGFYSNERDQPLSAHLFSLDGPKWRTLRNKFSPTFTSGKIKYMYKLVVDCTHPLTEMISKHAHNKQPIDAKDVLSRFTTDSIGSCAFGINCNSFTTDRMMNKMAREAIDTSTAIVRNTVMNTFPNLSRFLRIVPFPKVSIEYFASVITDAFAQRKRNLVNRTDFLQLMKDIQEKKNNEDFDLTLEEIQAQSFLFLLAGYETSSTAMTYLFLELAENLDVQEKLREEILEVSEKHDGITYDALHEMKYLQCVVDETLRKYPPVPNLNRQCTEDYLLPNGEVLEKGTNIIVPVLAIHRNEEYYPDPDRFDPERFSDENKANRHPYTYLPFGDGPRNCIGARFGLVQMKVAVSHLVSKFRFTVNKNMDTTRHYSTHFVLTLTNDVLLDIEEIQ